MKQYRQAELTGGRHARLLARSGSLTGKIIQTGAPLGSLSNNHGHTRASQPRFRHYAFLKSGVPLLPFPTGRKFSKKFFIFFPTGRNLAQIYVDDSLLVIIRCSCDERGTQESQCTGPDEWCEGKRTRPQPSGCGPMSLLKP